MRNGASPARPRILFVINSLAGGGAERVLLALLAASREMADRYDFSLALLDDDPRDYVPPDWLTVHQLDARHSLARSVMQLGKLVRAVRPAATLSFLTRANIASVAVAKLHGHRAIISERANTSGHFGRGAGARVARAIVRLAYARADRVVAVSRGIADDLVANFGVAAGRVETIANPVDTTRLRAAASEPIAPPVAGPYVVAVSRLTRSKNVMLLVEGLAASGLPHALVVMGQGAEQEAIRARAAALGLADRVSMPGFIANPHAVMAQAAFYASGSNGEGFPNGQVEALALGLPVVATNCASGPSEVLDDQRREAVSGVHVGRWGILVPPNDVASMADGMRRAADPAIAARLSSAGPVRAAEYSVERAQQSYWDVIATTLAL